MMKYKDRPGRQSGPEGHYPKGTFSGNGNRQKAYSGKFKGESGQSGTHKGSKRGY